ncbi:MAG: PPC domain-containing protein, partial [Chloroflexota bacterium]
MRQLGKLTLLCGLLLVACRSSESGNSAATAARPSVTSTAVGQAEQTASPRPTRTPTPTETPEPSRTPTRTPRPTQTRPVAATYVLPGGWQELGNERLGLRIGTPAGWIDISDGARSSDWLDNYGPQMLLVADSQQSAERILTGLPLSSGRFVFGFLSDSIAPSRDPAAGLLSLLGEAGREETLVYRRVALEASDLPAAYVELDHVPLAEFGNEDQQLSFRLLSVADLKENRQAFFLMGADRSDWDGFRTTVDTMMHTITLSSDAATVGQQIESGTQVKGELIANTSQLWPFNSPGGQYATIALAPENDNIDLTLLLIDPGGNILTSMDDGYAGDLEVLTDVLLAEDGTYLIEVGEFFKEGGQYQLSLTLADQPRFGGGGRIEFGREVGSELSDGGEHTWIFAGTAGQEVSIVLTSLNEQLDVILEVRGPDGQELLSLDEGFAGDAEVVAGLPLPVTGEYQIIVHGFAGRGGAYTLALDEGGESTVNFYDAGDLAYGQSGRDFLRQDEAHAWFFEGSAGDVVTIEVTPLDANLDLDIWLLDPDLNEVAKRDEYLAGESEKIEEELPVDGQYLVLVREFFGEPGEYEIRLNAGPDDSLEIAGQIAFADIVSGTLPAGRNVGWLFQGTAGEIINVVLTPMDANRDLVLILVDPDGETAETVDTALSGLPEQISSFRLT